jgi:hypothetical protein
MQTSRNSLSEDQVALLQRAVEKLVRFGEQVAISPEQMIAMLDGGLCISELLTVLASRCTRSGLDDQPN